MAVYTHTRARADPKAKGALVAEVAFTAVTIKGPLVAADVTNRPSLIKSRLCSRSLVFPLPTPFCVYTCPRRPNAPPRQKKTRQGLINSALWRRWLTGWLGLLFPNYTVKLPDSYLKRTRPRYTSGTTRRLMDRGQNVDKRFSYVFPFVSPLYVNVCVCVFSECY